MDAFPPARALRKHLTCTLTLRSDSGGNPRAKFILIKKT